jgi:hypothetical protein
MDQHAYAPATSSETVAESTKPQPTGDASQQPAESGNVDKIREILFGGQMREYEKKFVRLEERLAKEASELRDDIKRSVDALETFVKKEFEALTNRLQAEQLSRENSIEGVSRELLYTARGLETKLAQFDNQAVQGQRDLRHQLLEQSKTLGEEIRRKYEEVSTTLEREVAELNNDKTDRASLSALFTELALRLNRDFKIPGDSEGQR